MAGLNEAEFPLVKIDLRADQQWQKLGELRARTREYGKDLGALSKAGRDAGEMLSRAFTSAALRGKDLSSTLRTMIISMSERTVRSAITSLGNAITSQNGGLFSSLFTSASGNAFSGGRVIPLARGGIVSAPTVFPMPGGQTGLMGEAGPEAVMPLARGPDGRLGVTASTDGGRNITINFNVTTPDVGGFRRSEAQIAAMLSRAAERGGRNL